MVKEGEHTIDNLYQGGYSSLSPSYGDVFTGYSVDAGSLGMTTDPRTANILKDASTKLAAGAKQIELALVSPEIFDSVPKDQLKEVHRLGKLTGVDVSVHAPVMDSAGFTQQGFSEINREAAERRMAEIIERSNEVDPSGNVPVTFHSSEGIPGTEWEITPDGRKAKRMIAVNRETGKMIPLEVETKYYPDMEEFKPGVEEKIQQGLITKEEIRKNREKYIRQIDLKEGKIHSAEKNLKVVNETEWDNSISQVFFNKERADEILQKNQAQIEHVLNGLQNGTIREEEINKIPEYRQAMAHHQAAANYLQDVHTTANALFSRAYKYGNEEDRKILEGISETYKKELEGIKDALGESRAMQNLLNSLKAKITPQMNVPIEKFAAEKSSQSFGNAAFESYKKFGTKAPVMSIENPPAGFALSTGEDLKNLIEKSREQFVAKAVESGKLSEKEAKAQAEKLIGATWDVGHINMLRKSGATEEDVIRETEKIAPFVKHIHLSDNFGFEHTELPMGMGNVPIKEMMEKLPEKDVKKIIEAGHWWQHFQTPPLRETFEGLGAPMYVTGIGPRWNQSPAFQEGYFSGYGMMLPPKNYETWGSGFSMASLPMELGGQMPGAAGSRMGGTPME
jgi:sugar phosphate isomerase/epimerase